jgi:uncharacterized protein YqeY
LSLLDTIRADSTTALKAGDTERLAALRVASSELLKASKEGKTDPASEAKILERERKQRLEAAEANRAVGREEVAASEERKAEIIAGYLPKQLSDEELLAIVGDAVAESGASSPSEMGKVMPVAMARVDGRADGRRVSALVKETLTP